MEDALAPGNKNQELGLLQVLKKKIVAYRLALGGLAVVTLIVVALAISGVFNSGEGGSGEAKGTALVFHAASLVNLMQNAMSQAFFKETGYELLAVAKGSVALAHDMRDDGLRADIFISADPAVDELLMGSENGNLISWYVQFSRTGLGLGYSPLSPFKDNFEAIRNGSRPWYDVLADPRLKIGRTDPDLDPKGYRTVIAVELAQSLHNKSGLVDAILGGVNNNRQFFTEENLEKYVSAGDLDVGFFYEGEIYGSKMVFIPLPREIDQSDPTLNGQYSLASYRNRKNGKVYNGSAVVYTASIPSCVKNKTAAIAFMDLLLSEKGKTLMTTHGFHPMGYELRGDKAAVPVELHQYLP